MDPSSSGTAEQRVGAEPIVAGRMLRLIYVVGYGRSGSTVFERALAATIGGFRLGEMRHLWERGFLNGELCECGAPVPRCSFWAAVRERLGLLDDPRELLRLKDRVDRIRYIPFLNGSLPMPSTYRRRWQTWGRVIRGVYEAIAEVSRNRILLDSSKDPSYAYLLRSLFGPRVVFVHLVRRLPAVAHSWSRPKPRPEIHWTDALMPRYPLLRAASEWTVMNLLAAQLGNRNARGGVMVRYEDLLDNPRGTVLAVAARIGLPARSYVWHDRRTFDCGPGHTVSGNPVRFEPPVVTIRLDECWKSRSGELGYRLLMQWDALVRRAWDPGPFPTDAEVRR